MKNIISSWIFLESILPGEVPSLKTNIEGRMFKDMRKRKRVNPLKLSQNLWETVLPKNEERHDVKFCYYLDCYEQHHLVKLFREHFKSKEEIINKDMKKCFSFSFEVNAKGEYITDSLFIPQVQLIIKDIQENSNLVYDDLLERYGLASQRLEEAANSIFSSGVDSEGIQKLRHLFYDYFGSLISHYNNSNTGYVEIILENKKYPKKTKKFNSFYISDLQQIQEKGVNSTLEQFVTGKPLIHDIDDNAELIQQILLPENLPLGRWPSPVKHRLSLMQQVAVNQIVNGNEKINSVNGPPGTGKTTLLKDVFAQIIVERAMQMVAYDDPTKAFKCMGKLVIEDKYTYEMFKLEEEISKYSMVVASSNNGAVENISKDLPKLDAIVRNENNQYDEAYAKEIRDLDLFSDISSELIQNEDTWGLFSAALGSSSNITKFSKAINGLQAEKGQQKLVPLRDRLKLSLPDQAWKQAVDEFNELRQKIEQRKEDLHQFAQMMIGVEEIILQRQCLLTEIEQIQADEQQISIDLNATNKQKNLTNEQLNNLPSLTLWQKFCQLFYKNLSSEENQIREQIFQLIDQQKQLEIQSDSNNKALHRLKVELGQVESRLAQVKQQKENYRGQVVFPTKDFWRKEMYEERQKSVLWQTDQLNFERGLLFLKALKVQKVFLMANEKPVKAALAVFSNRHSINLNIDENIAYMKNMWNIMHLIVPVVSTTFASFSSMYRGLGKDIIDYLFVDEAGQASPQQSAGALWRSKRAIIVGDPNQIEPVVTTDETILNDIRKAFQVSSAYIGANASVQSLADYANSIGTCIGEGANRQRIGIPLWVHRRCIEPMFSIANRIAYNNKMVLWEKKIGNGEWHHITGNAIQAQYVQEQGEFIVQRIQKHINEPNFDLNKLFVITPFTAVKDNLKNLLKEHFQKQVPNLDTWVDRSIGTVHTFQGKEADIVYFVTGTDIETDQAANWTCLKPNLLNVAVTRAKKEFYVVGDLERFKSKKYYNEVVQAFLESANKAND